MQCPQSLPTATPVVPLSIAQHSRCRARASPITSPSRTTRSPNPMRLKRARTLDEAKKVVEIADYPSYQSCSTHTGQHTGLSHDHISQLSKDNFLLSEVETSTLQGLPKTSFVHLLQQEALSPDQPLWHFKEYYGVIHGQPLDHDPSNVVYLSIIDHHADSLSAMAEVATMLYQEYVINSGCKYLVVVGDGKTYVRLRELKCQYGSELEWLVPFIGDWHTLHNYQKVIMKVYYEAGLRDSQLCT